MTTRSALRSLLAAEAPAVAVLAPHELRHHEIEARALGDAVAVAPVVADHGIVLGQMGAGRGGHGLLAHVAVSRALDVAGVEQLHRALVETADAEHGLIQRFEGLAAQGHGSASRRWRARAARLDVECVAQELRRVPRAPAREVLDLLATGDARSDDLRVGGRRLHGGRE